MLKTKVKASAVTNLTDARYFAAWEVEWLGFNLDAGSADYIPPSNMEAIREWVDGVKILGEFNLQPADEILSAVDTLNLDAVQVGMFTDLQTIKALHEAEVPVIQEMVVQDLSELSAIETQIKANEDQVQYFVLDFSKNSIRWADIQSNALSKLQELSDEFSILLSVDFPAGQIESVLEATAVAGISVRGGEEEKVGYKSFDELDDLFETLETFEE
jgi:phosphoribosylanthranilate isomerase